MQEKLQSWKQDSTNAITMLSKYFTWSVRESRDEKDIQNFREKIKKKSYN